MRFCRKTGYQIPSYNFGEMMILISRIDDFEGFDTLLDLFTDEAHLYCVSLQREITQGILMKERVLTFKNEGI